jgi:DNA-binding FadR family transcriptional regulator
MTNTPIHRKSLAHEVSDRIKEAIRTGQYGVNEKLPTEPELMKQLGVGRSTIREAVRMLANSGLLSVQQGIGTFVADPIDNRESLAERLNRAASEDIDEIRQLLEVHMATKAAINRTQVQLDEIESFLNDRVRASIDGNIEACVQADINFHLAIAKASGNEMLADMYGAFSSHLKNWFLNRFTAIDPFLRSNNAHLALLASIKSKDPVLALRCAQDVLKH